MEIAGVAVSWYLWDRLESWQARMFVFYNADLIQFFTAGRFFRTSTPNVASEYIRVPSMFEK